MLVEVIEVSGQTVRLGISAPKELPIYREEIWVAVKDENERAAHAAIDLPEVAAEPPGDDKPR